MKRSKFFIGFLLLLCLTAVSAVYAQSPERILLDGSGLAAGQSFRFTVTVDSDEKISFQGAASQVSAVLCPVSSDVRDCRNMSLVPQRADETSISLSFQVDELPTAGDYTLDIVFSDESGLFAETSAYYLIRGVRDVMAAETRRVTLRPELLNAEGTVMIYGSAVYVSQPYTFRISADTSLNDSVSVTAALPASFSSLPVDPESECLRYLNADRTALEIPGSQWNPANSNVFSCDLRFYDSAWISANPIEFTLTKPVNSTYKSNIEFIMDKLSWNYYPVNIAKIPATHQFQIYDSAKTLVCSDTVACGQLRADEVYTMTYKFPADWDLVTSSGKDLTAEIEWPEDWALGLQQTEDAVLAAEYGSPCVANADGKTVLSLNEVVPGRYVASCTFVPDGITNPRQEMLSVHLNDNSYQVNDLKVWLPASILKTQAVLTPSLTYQASPGSGASEQIQGGSIGTLYRTVGEFPNASGSEDAPALYTLRADIGGVSPSRKPQANDAVLVRWSVLDSLAQTGDLPSCLVPAANGYVLGTLEQTEDGSWAAECSFRFPETMNVYTPGGALEMQLSSGAYQTNAWTYMNGMAFRQDTLYVDLSIPDRMLLMQPTEMRVNVSDGSGTVSEYLQAVLASSAAGLSSTWEYNYLTDCQGLYDLDENGSASCTATFMQTTDAPSSMHFELTGTALSSLFNIQYRPAQDVTIPAIAPVQAVLTPSLTLHMTEASAEEDAVSGGTIGSLYRTVGDYPNLYADPASPAKYTLKADISGLVSNAIPQPGDSVLVNWPLLDGLALTGDLPSCLTPAADGYTLGVLADNGDGTWSASCELRFPQSMEDSTVGSPLEMELVSMAYDASARLEMGEKAFVTESLYVALDVPDTIPLMQETSFSIRVSDSSGGLSDYTKALLAADSLSVYADWIFNYATDCQGFYELSENGESYCGAYFDMPIENDTVMHFELNSSLNGKLFNAEFRPSQDIHITGVTKMQAELTPSLKLHMSSTSPEEEVISGGTIGKLYRTVGVAPNAFGDDSLPARYTLRAELRGIDPAYDPAGGDYVRVKWPVLDNIALAGDLPSCLTLDAEGYVLGNLLQAEDGNWVASCDFRFPQSVDENTAGAELEMELISPAYEAEASVGMYGNPFSRETLYVDLDVPDMIQLKENAVIKARVTDDSGGYSDYMRALLAADAASLYSEWNYNYVSACQGLYEFNDQGEAECGVYFEFPTDGDSQMHFDMNASAAGVLFDTVYRPSADFVIPQVSYIQAALSVKLVHDGTEIPLPASDSEAFEVGEDYQLQFVLKPEDRFQSVLNSVSVDEEGLVLDWWDPLIIQWAALPAGQTSLNFYRDGDHFTARYDFNFNTGGVDLFGNLSVISVQPWIDGWTIEVQNGYSGIQLPSRINKKALKLTFSDFTVEGSTDTVGDLYVNQQASFDVYFDGNMDTFDYTQMLVGYEDRGIQTPLNCFPDNAGGSLHCSITAVCSDLAVNASSSVCADNVNLYAYYNGDTVNEAAQAEEKFFNIKRNELYLTPAPEGSLSKADLITVQAASEDLQYMGYGSMNIGGWNVDSFLPRQTWTQYGNEFGSYPINFHYQTAVPGSLDGSLMRLDVTFETGSASAPVTDTISLPAFMVTDDTVTFILDFGSYDILDDGRTAAEALDKAVTIKSLTARYPGSALVAPASRAFESEDLTFALKAANYYETELDLSLPYTLAFGGPFAMEAATQPFTVYCSQLYQPLECSSVMPEEQPIYAEDPGEGNDEGNGGGEEESAEPEDEFAAFLADSTRVILGFETAFNDEGCWGRLQTSQSMMPQIYVNNSFNPQCYLAAMGSRGELVIASNVR